MVLVDSSVWIDFLRDLATPHAQSLAELAEDGQVVIGDLILAEVLQGCRSEQDYQLARRVLEELPTITIAGRSVALAAAAHYRTLRAKGVTIRRTIDTLIAARCIADGLTLLHKDRDFTPFAEHLGLKIYAPAMRLH